MIRPLRDFLVLRQVGEPPGKVGLIHIPDTGKLSQATGSRALVLAAGPKCVLAKEGDTVWVKAYGQHLAGDEIEFEGEKLIMIRERDVDGILEEEPEPKKRHGRQEAA